MKTVLIAGAGIIGLATALELAARGVNVTVLERGIAMQEASWAAAGMLAANDPENPPQLAPLSRLSLSLYPEFLRRIEQLSGHRVPFRTTHTLQICPPAHTPADALLLSRNEAEARVPGLSPHLAGNLLWLDEASLDPRDLCRALPIAARAAGVQIIEHCPADSFDLNDNGVAVRTPNHSYDAQALIVCCGAWSGIRNSFAGENRIGSTTSSLPRKGQMLAVRLSTGARLTTVIRTPEIYLVPRAHAATETGNRIVIGATVENAGFDRSIRPESTAWLLEKAAALWPPIRNAQLEEEWTGLRPGTPDGLPLIGQPDPADARLWLATGHYRNGILLAPGTASLLASALLAGQTHAPVGLSPLAPGRFVGNVNRAPFQNASIEAESVLL